VESSIELSRRLALHEIRFVSLAACVLLFASSATIARAQSGEDPATSTQIYGGIEIGAQGVKRMLIALDSHGNIVNAPAAKAKHELPAVSSQNLGLASAFQPDRQGGKRVSDAATALLVRTINRFKRELSDDFGVPENHIVLAISSGVASASKSNGAGDGALKSLEEAIVTGTGLKPIVVTGPKEAQLTFQGVVPSESKRAKALLIDVGGGNTKFATKSFQGTVPYGARTLNDARKKAAPDADKKADLAIDGLLREGKIDRSAVDEVYLSGGSAYIVASLLRPREVGANPNGVYELTLAEIRQVNHALDLAPSTAAIFDEKVAELKKNGHNAAAKNLMQAGKIYDIDHLRAGVWLLNQAVAKTATTTVIFNGDGQVAWLKGLVVETARLGSNK
jgi:hypothetical protein